MSEINVVRHSEDLYDNIDMLMSMEDCMELISSDSRLMFDMNEHMYSYEHMHKKSRARDIRVKRLDELFV